MLEQKCEHRGLPVPELGELEAHRENLEGSWQPMLGHQIQALPSVASFWNALPEFFAWLRTGVAPALPATYPMAADETVLRDRTLRLQISGRARSYLEIIRFAAANRLCVDLEYRRSVRRIEPYSLRRTRDGNIILHATRAADGEHRSYRVDYIEGARTTGQSFIPRFAIELSPQGPAVIPPTAARSEGRETGSRRARLGWGMPGSAVWTGGPRYIYECAYCGKRFTRKKRASRLNPHKDKSGIRCPGRAAVLVDTRF